MHPSYDVGVPALPKERNMAGRPKTIAQVVASELCSGCGVCAYLQPDRIRMVDVPEKGLRPHATVAGGLDVGGDPIRACPGGGLEHQYDPAGHDLIGDLSDGWGPVRQIWEGHAADEQLWFAGSSGGAASALALYALEQAGFEGVLHVGASDQTPYLNQTVWSTSRDDLLRRTGSRYAPASPCDKLQRIERADGPSMLIAKPCDIAAAQRARRLRTALDEKLEITVAFFCAGTPSTNGTLEMLRAMGIHDPSLVRALRYRGNGWPGKATAELENERSPRELTYEQSWGQVLSKHVQWRCRLCVDHTGEFADIAVGDPWYREIRPGEFGSSLIVARTERGQRLIESAISDGYLVACKADATILPSSQPNLLRIRGAVWGRVLGLRAIRGVTPHYVGLPTFRFWWSELSFSEKVRSVLGTIRRCLQRGLHPYQSKPGASMADESQGYPEIEVPPHSATQSPKERG
jgi:coenzyme F420 hydrogenase subunit beta